MEEAELEALLLAGWKVPLREQLPLGF